MASGLVSKGLRRESKMRRRNPAATKAAILGAARGRFLRESFEGVGLRDIARDAGADPALIGRYFGGKEGLFRAVAEGLARPELFLDLPPRGELPAYLASIVVQQRGARESDTADACLLMTRSASSPIASGIIRELIARFFLEPLGQRLGCEGERRARLILAIMTGASVLQTLAADADSGDPIERQRAAADFQALFEIALTI